MARGNAPALDLLHALQMIIPGLLCVVVSWNCPQQKKEYLKKSIKNPYS